MKRDKVIELIKSTAHDLGVPEHLYGVKVRPSEVHFDAVFGAKRFQISARSGTSEDELRSNLERLAMAWIEHTEGAHQIDLEEAIAAASAAPDSKEIV